ncbi:hypothetical protein WDW37_14215 [Bdellovibrionota bacterium FG-1]
MRSPHLKKLAEALQLRAEDLLRPLPVLGDPEATRKLEAELLWDRLYVGLIDFSIAVVRGELPALGRLVQVFGIYKASKIAGPKIWERFSEYKRYIRPIRREELEKIWILRQNLSSSAQHLEDEPTPELGTLVRKLGRLRG